MIFNLFRSTSEYPEASISTEDGFVDISMSISKYQKTQDGGYKFELRSKIDKNKVGFDVFLDSKWRPHEIDDSELLFHWGKGRLESCGTDSDNFVNELVKLYGGNAPKLNFRSRIKAEVVMLSGSPDSMEAEPFRMKFFFNSEESEDLYSEVFINFDISSNTVGFNEKDIAYRAPLIKSLAN